MHQRLTGYTPILLGLAVALLVAGSAALNSQTIPHTRPPDILDGKRLYNEGCVACHGSNGAGAPMTSTEFARPSTFPDFTRCDQTTPEPDSAWKAVITYGGRYRGFSTIMPAFGELLTSEQIDDVIAYMRGFCTQKGWPRGELNLPRALVTEKAFPENELVISTAVNASGAPGFTSDVIHEQTLGRRNQLEVDLPVNYQNQNHNWYGGIGDITFGLKHVMYSNLRTGSILSLQGGILPPTGNSKRGFGNGTTTFEPFAAFGQLFKENTFVQLQMGANLPWHPDVTPQSLFGYATVGQAVARDHALGRLWTPMVEALATRNLQDGAKTNWDVLPEMQVTVSPRQHIRVNVGVRTPVTNTSGRSRQVIFYLLWDWADGKFWEGW